MPVVHSTLYDKIGNPSANGSVQATVTDTTAVGDHPNAIVVGEGGVWVSARHDDGSGEVVRIDPGPGEIVARIGGIAVPADPQPSSFLHVTGTMYGASAFSLPCPARDRARVPSCKTVISARASSSPFLGGTSNPSRPFSTTLA